MGGREFAIRRDYSDWKPDTAVEVVEHDGGVLGVGVVERDVERRPRRLLRHQTVHPQLHLRDWIDRSLGIGRGQEGR